MFVPVRTTIVDNLHASGVQFGRVDDGVEPAPGSRFLKLRSLKTLAQFVRLPRSLEVEEWVAAFELVDHTGRKCSSVAENWSQPGGQRLDVDIGLDGTLQALASGPSSRLDHLLPLGTQAAGVHDLIGAVLRGRLPFFEGRVGGRTPCGPETLGALPVCRVVRIRELATSVRAD